MTELRAQVNVRIDPDMNISITLTRIVQTPQEAADFGEDHGRFVTAYVGGYARGAGEAASGSA